MSGIARNRILLLAILLLVDHIVGRIFGSGAIVIDVVLMALITLLYDAHLPISDKRYREQQRSRP